MKIIMKTLSAIAICIVFVNVFVSAADIESVKDMMLKAKWDKIIKTGTRIAAQDPDEAKIYYFLQMAYYAVNDIDSANKANDKITKLDADGQMMLPFAEKVLSSNTDNPYAYLLMEYSCYYAKDYIRAKELLEKAIELKDDMGDAYFELAMMHDYTGDKAKARQLIEEGIQKAPDFLANYMYLNYFLTEAGDEKKIEENYKKAIKKSGKDTVYFHRDYSAFLARQKRFDESKKIMEKGLEIKPDDYRLLLNKADLGIMLEEYEEAEAVLDEISRLEPGNKLHDNTVESRKQRIFIKKKTKK